MRDHILAEIRRIAAENDGKSPGKRLFETQTGIRESQWSGVFWARWSDALKDAGLLPNVMNNRIPVETLLNHFAQAVRHFRKIPTSPELKLYARSNVDFPDVKTVMSYFGNKDGLIQEIQKFAKKSLDHADILEFVSDVVTGNSITGASAKEGWVYLLQSSTHYKIGRSDQIEKRLKTITIALPEATVLVHAIKTDDPPGIEAYWHRRFDDRRANGEWFKLSKVDIAAFKKRKFM
jgi:Meiotically up-regulated gene 113